jgi:hypothetical protein
MAGRKPSGRKHHTTKKPSRRVTQRINVIGGRKKRRAYKVSGTSAIGRSHHRGGKKTHSRKKSHSSGGGGFLAGTRNEGSNLMKIAKVAGGMAVGYIGAQLVIKPAENWLVNRYPGVAKFLAVGEVVLGGMIALKSKNAIVKSAGVGIMASGVQNAMTQFNVYKMIPGIHGPEDQYTRISVPISGSMNAVLNGLLADNTASVNTPNISGANVDMTPIMSGANTNQTSYMSGHSETSWMSGDGFYSAREEQYAPAGL